MHQLLIEKDVVIPVRDGATIYATSFARRKAASTR